MEWKNITDLSKSELEEFLTYQLPELELKLSSLIGNKKFGKDLKYGIIIDFFINAFQFSKEKSLATDQMSWLLRTQGDLLSKCEEGLTLEENVASLLQSINTMPIMARDGKFDTKLILNFILESLFQHYHLYKFLFAYDQENVQLDKVVELERVPCKQPFPPPLEEAILESLYEEYLNPKPIEEDTVEEVDEDSIKDAEAEKQTEPQEVPDVNILLSTLKPEELKKIIEEIANPRFNSIKAELEGKIGERESAMTKTFNKLQAR